jgi:hypothetical protein
MATKELRELRHKYKTAYTRYMHCVQLVSDASNAGVWPPQDVIKLEHELFNELSVLRQKLLEALLQHSRKNAKDREVLPSQNG